MYQIQSKRFFPLPDYDLTRERVGVKFTGKVLDQEYAKQLATVDNLTLHDIIALDKVQKGQVITENEADALRKKSLIEGRKNSYIIAADVAKHTEQQAEYMLLKGLNEKYYEAAVLDLLQQFGEASRSDFDKLLYNKLPEVLTDEQKFHKIKNLLQKMKKKKLIYFEDKVWKLV